MYLADASLINKLSPFFVSLFAWIFLKEKPKNIQIIALFVVFVATIFIIKPEFGFSLIPALIGLLSAISAGAAYTFIRFLKDKEHPGTIVFFFSLTSVIVMVPFCFYRFRVPDFKQTVYLLLIGIFATIGQYGLTYAYKLVKANEVAIFTYTNVLFATFFGILIWKEIPDIYTIAGGIVVITVSIISYLIHTKE